MNINSVIFLHASVGDYIFLIMIVVASVIQAISQNKKKKSIQEMAKNEAGRENSQADYIPGKRPEIVTDSDGPYGNIFDSIERMLDPEPDVRKHNWGDDYHESVNEQKDLGEADSESNTVAESPARNLTEKQTETVPSEPLTHTITRYKSGIRYGFSMKKAVVYSEILNRKYS